MPNRQTDYAVVVMLETPDGFPLICDPQKPFPRFWKFPGGRSQPHEIPLKTAIRELHEETGICVSSDKLKLIHKETRIKSVGNHGFFVFYANVSRKVKLLERGSGNELVKCFPRVELKKLLDFFPNHRALAERFLFI